uniref:SUI1 domain-containing protein n=1 Tax=Rhabditophanes sp. KR3021 TaxID=114890 RepID=A0AC35TJM9_9BILA
MTSTSLILKLLPVCIFSGPNKEQQASGQMDELIKAVYYVGESAPNPEKLHLYERMSDHFSRYNLHVKGNHVRPKKEERMKEINETKKEDGSMFKTIVVKVPTRELAENLECVLTEYFGSQECG